MRLILFFILGVAVTTAFAQSEARSRLRGSRRFSITSPGLQSSRRRDSQPVETPENTETADAAPSDLDAPTDSRTRSRGSSLLRRARPSRLRGRTDPEPDADQAPAEAAVEEQPSPSPKPTNGRGGLRIRRPLKKITRTTTTTTTTTTEASAVDVMPMEEGEMGSEASMKKEDKVMENAVDATETIINEEAPTEEAPEPTKATKPKGIPRPKLRPIPIKIGSRKSAAKVAPQSVPAEAEVPQEQEESTTAVSSHRFSSRPRGPRIQSRRRTTGRVTPSEQPAEQQVAAEEPQPAPVRTRSRSHLPSIRGTTRLPSRRTPAAVEPEATDADQETPVEQPTESRLRPLRPQRPQLPASPDRLPKPKRRRPPMRKQQVAVEDPVVQEPVVNKPKRRRPSARPKPAEVEPEIFEEPAVSPPRRVKQRPQQNIFEAPLAPSARERRPPLRVAPEASTPRPQFPSPNYGGSDLVFRGGEVHITQIGTIDDTPIEETQRILRGFGSRRRGLGRPKDAAQLSTIDAEKGRGKSPSHLVIPADSEPAAATQQEAPSADADYLYDYYDYATEE